MWGEVKGIMSLHRSLKIDKFSAKKRSVRKRQERIRSLILQRKWEQGQSVFGLPKEKIIKIKPIKSEKKKVETTLVNLIK